MPTIIETLKANSGKKFGTFIELLECENEVVIDTRGIRYGNSLSANITKKLGGNVPSKEVSGCFRTLNLTGNIYKTISGNLAKRKL
jgi:hypothetical protein